MIHIVDREMMPEVLDTLLYVQPTHLPGEFDGMRSPGLRGVEGKSINTKRPPAEKRV